jgi:hypothetical protein
MVFIIVLRSVNKIHVMKKIILLTLIVVTFSATAQKLKLVEGDLSALKGLSGISTEFTYDDMSIGKNEKESDYIAEKKAKFNQKEAGRGDSWEKSWIADRKDRFEPQFRELFAKHSEMSAVDAKSPYTMIFKTTRTEPGFNVGVMRYPAFIDGEAWIVDSSNKSKVLAKITVKNSPGRDAMGFDFETGARLQEAYAKAGKELGQFIRSKTKK